MSVKLQKLKKATIFFLNQISIILLILIGIIVLRVFCFDLYKIPSSSMSPTLLPGDYIIVNKLVYGPRVISIWKLFFHNKIEYKRYKGYGQIKQNDVFVFNLPDLNDHTSINFFVNPLVKRCYTLPNDSVIIKSFKPRLNRKKKFFADEKADTFVYFPNDSSLKWTLNNYGPLWVPAKGKNLKLTVKNAKNYRGAIIYEGYKISIIHDSVFLNDTFRTDFIFKYNYYFMRGDNSQTSIDSRYWGYVPETHVIGKAVLVFFSLDPEEPWYKCFKWKRLCKRIK